VRYNITIKGKKYFISYSLVIILRKKVDSFGLSITKEKLEVIIKLVFLKTIKELEIYLGIAS